MFTGIVQGTGTVLSVKRLPRGGARIRVRSSARGRRYAAGESVCVSGVCLTALESGAELLADLSPETLARTNLGSARVRSTVNLERSLRWGDALSGHFVMGHVDGVAPLLAVAAAGNAWTYRFGIPRGLGRLVAEKGSVALDGVSLTVSRRSARHFDVAVIPETRRRTTLGAGAPGTVFNFEADVFARYGRRAVVRARHEARRRT